MAAYYRCTVREFLDASTEEIVGEISLRGTSGISTLRATTVISWERTVVVLRRALPAVVATVPDALDWGLLLEYEIPRRGRRIDVVLLARSLVLVLEFKTGDDGSQLDATRQAEHYSLDLRDFHRESFGRILIPIAVCRRVSASEQVVDRSPADPVRRPLSTIDDGLADTILLALRSEIYAAGEQVAVEAWDESDYQPVPNIVEAARMLYAHQSIRELSHAHADVYNLTATTDVVIETVERAERQCRKVICFVTGVPGAGKTLAGLSVIHSPELSADGRPAGVFLSGNGPLVKIVSEALARDNSHRIGTTLEESRRRVRTFVQSVHNFLKEYRLGDRLPPERVIVFDEAQRAWDAKKVSKEMRQRATAAERDSLNEIQSEPAMMLGIMDRFPDWAVIIALIGGGQEIHDGEAGLAEWGRALLEQFSHWQVVASPDVVEGGTSVAGTRLFDSVDLETVELIPEQHLHLPVSVRSFRAESVATWVNAVVNGDPATANSVAAAVSEFPIVLTRSLDVAREWLRRQTRGLRRCGLLASSGALRLRAHGLEVSSDFRKGFSFEDWFLAPLEDIRSSNMLEVALTEFECQGLELDHTAVCWAGDFIHASGEWQFRKFKGTAWQKVQKPESQEFIRNKYRVLLTRAREGFVIWIPQGDSRDRTREPELFDSIADYLVRCGAQVLSGP